MEFSSVLLTAAELMAVSARTAPKSKGSDVIEIRVLGPDQLEPLAVEMEEISSVTGMKFFLRDAGNVRQSGACLLIGVDGLSTLGLNCGACGHATCAEMKASVDIAPADSLYKGPVCALRSTDLGIAVGSAVKTASMLNVDSRVMFSAGTAAIALGLLPGSSMAFGIPLSVTGKSPFFDR
ncbi:DUF2148 domain-containing protein [Methanocorpusculum sp. MG]|uniref:DUF2148 domain-containing protein n=1 Tax=Methanocorpusculum petauri TaxID=3002863 RepID=A0ABT4ID62_9EURY|nr:DUF2148 domain-containing protein [Methanocorpusculum petauri]MCZ0859672.1 DUF2148 domain-containing protein [Methanocorpusculum petauri]MDE2444305.1 DUF2148 domain-containing protein [Methanocorpusculum sp.]